MLARLSRARARCTTPTSCCSGFARALRGCRGAGHPGPRARRLPRGVAAASGSTTSGRPTGPAGPRCAPAPTTSTATTRCSRPGSRARRPAAVRRPGASAPGAGARRLADDRRPATATATDDDGRPARWPARSRCCGTATSPTLDGRREGTGSPALFATAAAAAAGRVPPRHARWHRGDVDAARTLRAMLRRMGEPAELAWRRRGARPRRVVLLVDVSGSMSAYADALLRFAHRFSHAARGAAARSRSSPSAPG